MDLSAYWNVWLLALVAAVAVRVAMLMRLKRRHKELWVELGSPTIWNGNLDRLVREIKFLARIKYRECRDSVLTGLAVVYSALYVMVLALFIGLSFMGLLGTS